MPILFPRRLQFWNGRKYTRSAFGRVGILLEEIVAHLTPTEEVEVVIRIENTT